MVDTDLFVFIKRIEPEALAVFEGPVAPGNADLAGDLEIARPIAVVHLESEPESDVVVRFPALLSALTRNRNRLSLVRTDFQ